MPRRRSEDKRAAIMSAATELIALEGLGAATGAIAKQAGVSNGSLFTYFDSKADLFNQLYLQLKTEMSAAASVGATEGELREQLLSVWNGWLRWALDHPEKRRALAQLGVSDEITPDTRCAAGDTMSNIAAVVERARVRGPMRDQPLTFVVPLASALAEATIDVVAANPDTADTHARAGFDALWRVLTADAPP